MNTTLRPDAMSLEKIAIVGAGGLGREVLSLVRNANEYQPRFDVVGFVDDNIPKGTPVNGIPVIGKLDDIDPREVSGLVFAVGNSKVRKSLVERVENKSFNFPVILHPSVILQDHDRINIGRGSIIAAGTVITTDVLIGDFSLINLTCTIGHDAKLGAYCSLMPSVNISGGATLEEGVFVGTGVKLIKATTLGSFCTIGAGAVVNTDVPADATFAGVPAKPISPNA